MVDVYSWPPELGPRGVAFDQRGMTVGGPVSLTGQSQVGSIDAGYWIATYSQVPVAGPVKVKAFRALRARLEGGAHHIMVPAFDKFQAPWPAAGGPEANEKADQAWADGELWADSTGWFNPAIRIYLAEDALVRATSIVADVAAAGELVGGEYFSLAGGGMHVVREVLDVDGSEYTLATWPPLRGDAPAGRRCEFERPVCKMRLLTEEEMDLMLGFGRHGSSDIAFIEVF